MITDRVDGALLDAAPRVRFVANLAAGFDNIDLAACTARGVLVSNTPGVVDEATADMTFALILAVARQLPEGGRAIREGAWGQWHPLWLLGRQVSGATLGLVGPGRIARAVARRAAGFNMRVLYHGRREVPDFPGHRVPLSTLLAEADIVSMHVPLTEETAGMCDARFFAAMRPGAIFVNTTRGGVVRQDDLVAALRAGTIAGAALDVMTPEPLAPTDPLLAVDSLVRMLAGEVPPNVLNPEAAGRERSAR
jgi:glyoxylate reductase